MKLAGSGAKGNMRGGTELALSNLNRGGDSEDDYDEAQDGKANGADIQDEMAML